MASPSPTTVKIRNILVLGKTGCGKSTVANRILGQELFKAGGSLQPVTTKPCQQEAEFYDNDSRDLHYKFKLIDTVGLFDPSGRRNKEIVRETKAFFRENVPGLNLILFVYREGRFTQEEKQALDDITKHFKKSRIREILALVVTCCENYDVDRRRKLVEELKIHPSFEAFCELVQKGIYPVGFPDLTTASDEARDAFEESARSDQETLRKLVRESEEHLLCDEIVPDSAWKYMQRKGCNIL